MLFTPLFSLTLFTFLFSLRFSAEGAGEGSATDLKAVYFSLQSKAEQRDSRASRRQAEKRCPVNYALQDSQGERSTTAS